MKKYFLIACLTAFSFAAAQQNDFFDIQKHLQEKSAKKRLQKLSEKYFPPNPETLIDKFRTGLPEDSHSQAKLSFILPDGDKVYSLPMDHMPCIVSDKKNYADNMPTLRDKIKFYSYPDKNTSAPPPGAIPNPAYPRRTVPLIRK